MVSLAKIFNCCGFKLHSNNVKGKECICICRCFNHWSLLISGVGTKIDPTLCRADRLVGQVLGTAESLPDIYTELEISYYLLRRLLGVRTEGDKKGAKVSQKLHLSEKCNLVRLCNLMRRSPGAKHFSEDIQCYSN